MIQWPTQERRRFERVDCGANAVLFTRGVSIGHFDLCNLSACGALIEGKSEIRRGHLVHLVMRFDGVDEPIGVSALVHEVRHERDRLARLALSFPTVSADLEDYIQDAVVKALTRQVMVRSDRGPQLRRS